jgi:protein XagA
MMYRSLLSFVVVGSALFCAGIDSALAGAWLRDEGRSKTIFSSEWSGAKQRFDASGRPRQNGSFQKISIQTITEYGLTSDITLIAGLNGRQQRFSSLGLQQGSNNIGGIAGARLKLWSGNQTIFSFQARTELGSEQQPGLLRSRRFDPPAAADLRLLVGHSFTLHGMPVFVDVQGGYRWRNAGHPDEIRTDLTLGLKPMAKTLLLFQSFNTLAIGGDKRFATKPMRQHKLQASLVYELTQNLSMQVGGFASVAGRESLRERGGLFAFWLRL